MQTARTWLLATLTFAIVSAAQEAPLPSCAVIGFVNEVNNPEWRDGRVGMGVRALLAQSVAETNDFTLLEEKAAIKAKLEDCAKAAWLSDKKESPLDTAAAAMKSAGAAFIASGKVFYFGKPRTRASVGPAHFASDEVEIKIEVTLADARSGKKLSAIGSGKAATTAVTGIFSFHGENLDANASMVGTATKKAVDAAVAEIDKKYRKAHKIK
jgi:hypothetical protein